MAIHWYVVADGAHAQVFEQPTVNDLPRVIMELRSQDAQRRARQLGSDRPGRVAVPASARRQVYAAPSDPHEVAQERFVAALAALLDRARAQGRFVSLSLVAEQRTLGRLRAHLSDATAARVIQEVARAPTHGRAAETAHRLMSERPPLPIDM